MNLLWPLDLGAAFARLAAEAVLGNRDLVVSTFWAYVFDTGNPLPPFGRFTDTHVIHALIPWTQGVADAALVVVVLWGSFHIMWAHGVRSLYTVRVLLPRLLLAVALINFSLPLVQLAVDANNALCQVVQAMGLHFNLVNSLFTRDELGGVPTVPVLVTVALFVSYLVLALAYVIRFALLVVLTLAAPLAALLFVLPDTHHYAREWASLFVTTLFMQPAQLLIIGIGFEFEQASGHSPLRHAFALATVLIAFKVPGAFHSTSRAGSHLVAMVKHYAHVASHVK